MNKTTKFYSIIVLVGILILNGCSQGNEPPLDNDEPENIPFNEQQEECIRDADCPAGICPDGTTYNKYTCSENKKCII